MSRHLFSALARTIGFADDDRRATLSIRDSKNTARRARRMTVEMLETRELLSLTPLSANTDSATSGLVSTVGGNQDNETGLFPIPSPVCTNSAKAPLAPSFKSPALSDKQIKLSWSTVSGASGYLVDEWINGAWSQIGSFGRHVTSDTVRGLSSGIIYFFDVAAYNSTGTTWANYQCATTKGVNHPAAATAYKPVNGSLFGPNGPSYLDVQQGYVGDCWLVASLAEVAARDPEDIVNMFTPFGTTVENGSTVSVYAVRLFNSAGVAEYFTVDTELPSRGNYYDRPADGVLWVALAEKAYAEANGFGMVTTGCEGRDSYNALSGGYPSWALQAITGQSASDVSINPTDIAAAWNAGQLIVLCTTWAPADPNIVGDHAYALVNYNASSSMPFTIYNPWGLNESSEDDVYGLFSTDATGLEQNFALQSFGTGAVAGMDDLNNRSQRVGSILDTNAAAGNADTRNRLQDDGASTGQAPGIAEQNPIMPVVSVAHDRVLQSGDFDHASCDFDWLDGFLDEFGGGHQKSKKHDPFQRALRSDVFPAPNGAGAWSQEQGAAHVAMDDQVGNESLHGQQANRADSGPAGPSGFVGIV